MAAETWKDVPDFPEYQVSDLGRIRSKDRMVRGAGRGGTPCMRFKKGRILAGVVISRKEYDYRPETVTVTLCRDGHQSRRFVHHLVLDAFIGPCPPGLEGCHGDGDPTNNRLDNLRWDTHPANYQDSVKHGRARPPITPKGQHHYKAILTDEQVREIRRLFATGEYRQRDLAAMFDCHKTVVQRFVRGTSRVNA